MFCVVYIYVFFEIPFVASNGFDLHAFVVATVLD